MSITDKIIEGASQQRVLLTRLQKSPKPVIIYGAGVYAYVLKRFLAANGISVEAVMVDAAYQSDEAFIGMELITTEESAERLATSHIVVGITNYPAFVDRLSVLGATDIHVVDIPDYLNMPNAFMDAAFVKANAALFDQANALFADDLSRSTYVAAINCKITEDLEYIKPFVRLDNLYFPSTEFPLGKQEVLLDVGGFTGDTVREFHQLTNNQYAGIISLEPSDENFTKLENTVTKLGLTKVLPLKVGAWDEKATLRFTTKELHIDNQITEDGDLKIEVDTIDAILAGIERGVSMIKLDINGAEYRALSGAKNTIRKCRPRIIVRLHTKEDFFRLPILLKEIAPDIRLYVRQRNFMSMMVVLYGVFDSASSTAMPNP